MYQMQNGSDWQEPALPEELHTLFASYREALPDPEPSADFMPQLWARIEARPVFGYNLVRAARRLIAGAVAVSALLVVLYTIPASRHATGSTTYIDVLSNNHSEDAGEPELAHLEAL